MLTMSQDLIVGVEVAFYSLEGYCDEVADRPMIALPKTNTLINNVYCM